MDYACNMHENGNGLTVWRLGEPSVMVDVKSNLVCTPMRAGNNHVREGERFRLAGSDDDMLNRLEYALQDASDL